MVTVDQERCMGCGGCLDECPGGAVSLRGGKALIDPLLCTCCQRCIEVCPAGALQVSEAVQPVAMATPAGPIEIVDRRSELETPQKQRSWGGAVLALLGQYVLPRMADVLAVYLERRFSPQVQVQSPAPLCSSTTARRWRRRHRHGKVMSQIPAERR